MPAKYTLNPAYDKFGETYTLDEARALFAVRHGEAVTLRETANGRLVRLFVDRPFGLVVGQRVA
jgi:hypothetical protein